MLRCAIHLLNRLNTGYNGNEIPMLITKSLVINNVKINKFIIPLLDTFPKSYDVRDVVYVYIFTQ